MATADVRRIRDRSLEDDGGPCAPPGSTAPTRELIAYHEAGHATIGHARGLTFEVIYIGDWSGQILFDEQWEPESVVRDADVLDQYALMPLAGARAEQRYAGDAHGDQQDAKTLECMVREARVRGTLPRPGLWQRAEEVVAADWAAIEALAEELVHRNSSVECPRQVLR
jgi:hypothetical protein